MKKIKTIIITLVLMLALTGCTQQLKDKDNKLVQNPETGQTLAANIICQPEDKKTLELYKKNDVDVTKLPKCSEFTVTSGGYEGIWTSLFVKPLSWLIISTAKVVSNYGWSIIIITLLIRIILMPITNKTVAQSENLKKAKPELDRLEKKYSNKTDKDSLMQKNQEMMLIYKKNNINPMSGCLFSFLQVPLFFAFYESLSRIPAIYETKFLFFQLGTSPMVGVQNGHWYYAISVILIFLVTFYSFKLNPTAAVGSEQEKQMKTFTYVFVGLIVFASISMPTCIAIYWIINNSFTVIQNLIVKRRARNV